ncbi:MAG TPA: OmpA family protein [Anaeromyxobacteraceae bacterium]|nr:OmpA family protein [Anaeromyxobacteraceae bacterium]
MPSRSRASILRIVTHGILFDTGSDVIRPESGPSLRSILALLQADPALRFSIEGRTDDQGGPSANGPLSERRALAVKVWLVKQGVHERRLKTKGLGATKPIDSNDTAEGRANNRRVEFVKTSS